MNEKTFVITESLRAALLSYLSTRPYSEVHEGVSALLSLKENVAEVIEE